LNALLVGLGAAAGALLRYLVDQFIQGRHDGVFPWGTWVVNVVGSFAFGVVVGAARLHGLSGEAQLLLGTGLCGALTTFSTFGFETVRLVEDGSYLAAALNALGSVLAALLAAAAGYALAVTAA